MTHVRALEMPDGGLTTFTSPVPWSPGTVVPTINGRTRSVEYTVTSSTTIQFSEPPRFGDIVGFFLTPMAT